MDWFSRENVNRKTLDLMGKSMVSGYDVLVKTNPLSKSVPLNPIKSH